MSNWQLPQPPAAVALTAGEHPAAGGEKRPRSGTVPHRRGHAIAPTIPGSRGRSAIAVPRLVGTDADGDLDFAFLARDVIVGPLVVILEWPHEKLEQPEPAAARLVRGQRGKRIGSAGNGVAEMIVVG